jgi:2-methylisocitrate lyase-like PEP mutase family enzyme
MNQKTDAQSFAALHAGPDVLVLPNAWDAASAALMEEAGARAVATSSAAVAWAQGYRDGDALPLDKLLLSVSTVARAVKVPVSADIEGGYTDDLSVLADTIKAVIDAGAVGVNLEDGERDPALHARKIEAARKAADATGIALFINARIDVYLKGLAAGEAAYEETVRRAELYRAAGASGIFTPAAAETELIGRLAGAIKLPLNILLWAGVPRAAELRALGVRRVSSGSSPFRAAYAGLARSVAAYLADGDGQAFAATEGLPNLNARFA